LSIIQHSNHSTLKSDKTARGGLQMVWFTRKKLFQWNSDWTKQVVLLMTNN